MPRLLLSCRYPPHVTISTRTQSLFFASCCKHNEYHQFWYVQWLKYIFEMLQWFVSFPVMVQLVVFPPPTLCIDLCCNSDSIFGVIYITQLLLLASIVMLPVYWHKQAGSFGNLTRNCRTSLKTLTEQPQRMVSWQLLKGYYSFVCIENHEWGFLCTFCCLFLFLTLIIIWSTMIVR